MDFAGSTLAAAFAIDKDKAEGGQWFPLTTTIKMKLRRFKSKASQDARVQAMKPYAKLSRAGQELGEEISLDVLNKQLAYGVIVDWEGVEDGDGNKIPVTNENKYEVLKALPELRDIVFSLSTDLDSFKPDTDETVKN